MVLSLTLIPHLCSQFLGLNSLLACTTLLLFYFWLVYPVRTQTLLTPESLGHYLAHKNYSINLMNENLPPLLH